jgi:hypothetical protein
VEIVKLTPPSTTPQTLSLDGPILISGIAIHGGYVYVAGADLTANNTLGNGVLERVPLDGGPAEPLISNTGHMGDLVADDSGLYWVQGPPTFEGNSVIVGANLDGSSVKTLFDDSSKSVGSLIVANGRLYFTSDAVYSMPASGGKPIVVSSDVSSPGMLLVAGGNVVWVDPAQQETSDPTVPKVLTACAN